MHLKNEVKAIDHGFELRGPGVWECIKGALVLAMSWIEQTKFGYQFAELYNS